MKPSKLVFPLLLALLGAAAQAQASRTWVSGIGNDLNPCSRTAPCQTFAATLAKTAGQGELDALDPGAFGPCTITRGVTLDGGGNMAGLRVTIGDGIVVDAPGATVILRNLDLGGTGTARNGIKLVNAAHLLVEHCTISGFSQSGVAVSGTGAGQVVLRDVRITGGGAGVRIDGAAASCAAVLQEVLVQGAGVGVQVLAGNVTISRSVISMNATVGVQAAGSTVSLSDCTLSGNGAAAVQTGTGGVIRVANDGVYDNQAGFQTAGGVLASDRTNRTSGNTAGSATPNGAITLQ